MAYKSPTRPTPGTIITAADWNAFVIDNNTNPSRQRVLPHVRDLSEITPTLDLTPAVMVISAVGVAAQAAQAPVTRRGLLFSVFDIFKK